MEYLVICTVALLASGLTLFSGFGLGTILLPAFIIFFPPEVAIVLTAIVHFLNNIFKLVLLGKHAQLEAVLLFGLPAIAASITGASVLLWLAHLKPFFSYGLFSYRYDIMPVKLIVAVLMVVFALWETLPKFKNVSFDKKFLPLGGLLSGFFGGLSGHQGAMRSAFLVRAGLSKENFIATGVVIACLVDISRLSVYGRHILSEGVKSHAPVLLAAVLSAFLGAYIGNRLVKKVTLESVQRIVSVMLCIIAILLGAGII